MSLIAENPWPVVMVCLGVAILGLILLKFTQRGRYLFIAMGALGLAALLTLVDRYWVTDVERIEDQVRALALAVSHSDADTVEKLLDPDVSLAQEGNGLLSGSEIARGSRALAVIRATLGLLKFDFVTVSNLQTTAGSEGGQGKCDFRVDASGSMAGSSSQMNFLTGANGSDWSLGFKRDAAGNWKITRISAVRLPFGTSLKLPGILPL